MSKIDCSALFRPFKYGRLELSNRIVMAPMTRSRSPKKIPTDTVLEYYRRRAQGGVGLILTEGVNVVHPSSSGYPDVPYLGGEADLPIWQKIVEAVHSEGSKIMPQLWHVGAVRQLGMEPDPEVPGYGPSEFVHPGVQGKAQACHAMTQADIDEIIAAFAHSARSAERLGFDGIELHGAHGYLIDQFFWDLSNKRSDLYGGESLVARTRFAVEIIQAVRKAVSRNFPICLRFSQWKMGDYKHKMAKSPDDLLDFLGPLADAGVDIFHCSTRRFNEPEFEGSDLNLAGWAKKLIGKPTISVGSVGLDADFISSFMGKTAQRAEIGDLVRRMENDEFDLIALGRALLADPEWPHKARDGRWDEIVTFTPEHLATFP